jgi:transketolase
VREFGMAALMNGMALHGGLIPYGGTFLTFSDYSRNAIRMAALMKQRVIHVFTHDSIGLGEDGPTHQSVEHVPSLRLIPNLDVWRPADALETTVAWAHALERHDGPSALCLSRQNLPRQLADPARAAEVRRGGYVLSEAEGARAVILGTGSETQLAMQAQAMLATEGIPCVWSRCRAAASSTARIRPTRTRCCRSTCPRWRWRRRSRTCGASTWAGAGRWWASRVSASRRRRRRCTPTSASAPRPWPQR